jgi:hypothetical protein
MTIAQAFAESLRTKPIAAVSLQPSTRHANALARTTLSNSSLRLAPKHLARNAMIEGTLAGDAEEILDCGPKSN